MELELINKLMGYFYAPYSILIFAGTEVLKLFLRKEYGKCHFKFDTDKRIQFDLRLPIVIISLIYGIIIVVIENSPDIIFSLFITFCITNFFYEYIYKIVSKKYFGDINIYDNIYNTIS